MMPLKTCCRCHETKPVSEFNSHKSEADGLSSACRECTRAAGKAKYLRNHERILLQAKLLRQRNPERNKEHCRRGYQKHKAKRLAAMRRYRTDHAEEDRVRHHALYLKNKDEYLEKAKAYRRTERGRKVARKASAKERRKFPMRRSARVAVSNAVRDGRLTRPDQCQVCGAGPVEAHHYNGYEPENWLDVQWLCLACHKKADKAMSET